MKLIALNSLYALAATLAVLLGGDVAADEPDLNYVEMRFITPFDHHDRVSQELGGVNAIVQDKLGFIWIGGENGLARYDGRNLLYYKSNPEDSTSLPSNYVFQMVVDKDNVLWVGTEGGLARYDFKTDSFSRVIQLGAVKIDEDSVSALEVSPDGTLYVGTARGLYVIDAARHSMKLFLPKPPIPIEANIEQIRDIDIDRENKVWLATAGMGVAVFNPASESFEYFLHDPQKADSLAHNSVRSVHQDNKGRVWLGTYGGGISRLDPGARSFIQYAYNSDQLSSIGGNVIWDIKQDSAGTMWFAVDQGGLARFDENSGTFTHYRNRPYDTTSLVSDQLRVIYEDKDKDLWFGASPSGISYFSRRTHIFRHYITRPSDPTSLSSNAILRILEAKDGTIWVGTEGGLNAMNPATGKFKRYLANPGNQQALKANAVLAIEEDIDGQIWVGTWAGGLHKLDKEGKFRRYTPDKNDPASINSAFIWDITKDSKGNIWIATETGGLNRYERATDSFSHYSYDSKNPYSISGNFVTSLMEDHEGNLWLGGYTGVNKFDPKTEVFQIISSEEGSIHTANTKNPKAFFEDSKGRIWIGTQHRGVTIYDPKTKEFQHLDIKDGLPSLNISGILEDDNHDIWLTTGNGLAKINPNTKVVTVFGRESDLAGTNYNREALLKDRNGRLYFGSSEGITSFHPSELNGEAGKFPVRLVGFRIFNKEVKSGKNSPLPFPITIAEKIILHHSDTMFSFDFAALDYKNANIIHYSYKLDGFDGAWIDIGRQASATYTNLSPGNYTFHVRASNDEITWQESKALHLRILPPPWRTWWAYMSYALLIAGAFYYWRVHVVLRARAETYKTQAITDPLTGLYNRYGIGQIADGIFANAETKKGVGIALFDIDHFKKINDMYGHDGGDRVLVEIAKLARNTIRYSDSLGRWGGEEFVILYAVRDIREGFGLADKVRNAVNEYQFDLKDNPTVTVSVGFTMLLASDSFESALKRADVALYEAKRMGRNIVVLASSDKSQEQD